MFFLLSAKLTHLWVSYFVYIRYVKKSKCYNKSLEDGDVWTRTHRVWKYARDGSVHKHKHFLNYSTFKNFQLNEFKNDKFYFEEYPYRPYFFFEFVWWIKKVIKNQLKQLAPNPSKYIIILLAKLIGTVLAGLAVVYIAHRMKWNG